MSSCHVFHYLSETSQMAQLKIELAHEHHELRACADHFEIFWADQRFSDVSWPWGNLLLWTWWCRYLHGSCFNSRFHRGWKEGGTGELGSFVTVDLFACNFIYFTCTILRPMRFSFCQHCAWQQRQRERERRKEETRREEKRKEGKGREEKRDEERHHCTQTATFFTLSFVLRVAIALPLRCHCVAIALPLLLESSSTKQKKLFMIQRNRWIRIHEDFSAYPGVLKCYRQKNVGTVDEGTLKFLRG